MHANLLSNSPTVFGVLSVSGDTEPCSRCCLSGVDYIDAAHIMGDLPMLDAAGNTNGNVILQIDLLVGGYAAMGNFRIAASTLEERCRSRRALPS